jgi:dTDP-4-amino-4,6-dideoxygalactose transaminase
MKNRSRVHINTNFLTYYEVFKSLFINVDNNKFLQKLKNYLKVKNLILTSQGRVAIYILIKSLINNSRKTFITSPYTLTEALNAVRYAGGKLVFVDIDPVTGLPNENQLKKKINSKTAGIIITHLTSNEKNIKNFLKKFKKYNVIEDTAINFGASLNSKKLGTLSNFGIYSFGTMKNLCLINGGLLYVKDKMIFEKCVNVNKKLKPYPKKEFLKKTLLALTIDVVYNKLIYNLISHHLLSFINKFNITFIKKIIYPGLYPKFGKNIPNTYQYKFYDGVSKLGEKLLLKLEYQKKRRVKLIKIYEKNLNNLNELTLYSFEKYSTNSFLEYPICLKKNNDKKNLVSFLFKHGFDIREKWYLDNSKFKIFKNPYVNKNAKFLEESILCLPLNPNFSEQEILCLCSLIKKYFRKSNGRNSLND